MYMPTTYVCTYDAFACPHSNPKLLISLTIQPSQLSPTDKITPTRVPRWGKMGYTCFIPSIWQAVRDVRVPPTLGVPFTEANAL